MRSWLFGKGDTPAEEPERRAQDRASGPPQARTNATSNSTDFESQDVVPNLSRSTVSRGDGGVQPSSRNFGESTRNINDGFMQAFQNMTRGGAAAAADADMERRVSIAARNLGDGVQRIVMAARMGGGRAGQRQGEGRRPEWKSKLLELLGGSDEDVEAQLYEQEESDLDVLLNNSACERFVLRCVENELPPNLVHCLRLLRVLELQHAGAQMERNDPEPSSLSTTATEKVSKLLCLLCKDSSVGEQLRPHLFGLLALSGASYPISGTHIASSASSVIMAFSEKCLSSSLVWFLHDRRMIVHMTDDIKELIGLQEPNNPPQGLQGIAAEQAGLWVVALKTVVHLVVKSCNHDCVELLTDFEAAGGYHVICHAISNASGRHLQPLLHLVAVLVCCKTVSGSSNVAGSTRSIPLDQLDEIPESGIAPAKIGESEATDSSLATNPAAFEIVEELMMTCLPFLTSYAQEHNGDGPHINSDTLRELSSFSLRTALAVRFEAGVQVQPKEFDLSSELLVTTLQLYSDHAKNFDIIEDRHHILSNYLLSFPTFTDISVKVLILKTLEYVCTGLATDGSILPLSVACEIFFSLCKSLLKGADGFSESSKEETDLFDSLTTDAELMCATLEKLLQFDERVSKTMLDGGLLGEKLNSILSVVMSVTEENSFNEGRIGPPSSTPMDRAYSAICRVLKLVLEQSPPLTGSNLTLTTKTDAPPALRRNKSKEEQVDLTAANLSLLLAGAVKSLGNDASVAALSVFDGMMNGHKSAETMKGDMDFMIEMIDGFAVNLGVGVCWGQSGDENRSISAEGSIDECLPVDLSSILRVTSIFIMLKSLLEGNELAQEVFRSSGGFECLIRMTASLKDAAEGDRFISDASNGTGLNTVQAMMKLIGSALDLINAGTVSSARAQKQVIDTSMSLVSSDLSLEEDASQAPGASSNLISSPSACNRRYLRRTAFYVDFALAISATGLFEETSRGEDVLDLAMKLMEPSLKAPKPESRDQDNEKINQVKFLKNPDASRLVLGIAVCFPESEIGVNTSKVALDVLLRLTGTDRTNTTLSQLATCGLCFSLTSQREFATLLENRSHHLYSRFVLLLRRLAAFHMSHTDFRSLLRCIVGPILLAEGSSDAGFYIGKSKSKRVRLPVIVSSVKKSTAPAQISWDEMNSDSFQSKEQDFVVRLETLSIIAERGDRVPRCEVGGDSLSTIALYMNKVPVQDRLVTLSEQGRIRFLKVDRIDSNGKSGSTLSNASNAPIIWAPLISSGFTFSLWLRIPQAPDDRGVGSLFVLDLSSNEKNSGQNGQQTANISNSKEFISLWYDLQFQRFNVLSSASYRNEPTCFPVSPLVEGVWHHVILTYTPPKRPMLSKKAILGMFVDGRPLQAEVRVESVNLSPDTQVYIGAPNPHLASSGIVRGSLPVWELGPTLLFSQIRNNRDATAIFTAGPDFEGLFWGDRPQRLSLTATATAAFSMLAESGEQGSVAGALRRRGVPEVEAAGHVMREQGTWTGQTPENDSLAAVGLLCSISPEQVVFAYRASSSGNNMRDSSKRSYTRRLVNVARLHAGTEISSTDAIVHGNGSIVSPQSFADNLQWIGGPNILMPLVNAARSAPTLAMALRLLRESVHHHPPNLEMLQVGGGYRMLGVLLRQRHIMNTYILDQCFAFAVHGFVPASAQKVPPIVGMRVADQPVWKESDKWVFSDLDAMKYLLLNHQVWDLRGSGPVLPLRLLSFLNGLVSSHSAHAAFNSRRLHLLGIVRWTLHLMLEAAELFTLGEMEKASSQSKADSLIAFNNNGGSAPVGGPSALSFGWYTPSPSVSQTAIGRDPDNALLHGCKTLLRRVLTYMLTPGDLEAIAGAAIYTVSITGKNNKDLPDRQQSNAGLDSEVNEEEKLLPGPVARVYLIRLIEELVVDGVNEIVIAGSEKKTANDGEGSAEPTVQPHTGGGTNMNHSYSEYSMTGQRGPGGQGQGGAPLHPKHQQAQAFLSAFAGILTPVWFACILEGCREQASASAVLRLMILMLQSSPTFAHAFEEAGGFAPLVLSIPKFSTCPSVIISMLCQLLHAPILHVPCVSTLDANQICEVFDAESDTTEQNMGESLQNGFTASTDPSCGIFALLAECLGRNIQLAPFDNELGERARQTNKAVLQLLSHQHSFSAAFQQFCRTPDFLEPLAQALCLVHDEKLQRKQRLESEGRNMAEGTPGDTTTFETPTERFVGKDEMEAGGSGIGMVQLLHHVLSHAVMGGPFAAPLVSALFRSFPIHASPDQVEAFHLVLIEHCKSVVEDALQRGEPIALANCIGVSSVLLDRLMAGFFTSEPVLEAVQMALSTLSCLAVTGTYASRAIVIADRNLLIADAAHVARLTCLMALQRSRPAGPYGIADYELRLEVLEAIEKIMPQLVLVPASAGGSAVSKRTSTRGGNYGNAVAWYPTPQPGSRFHPLWQSASLARCCPPGVSCMYPDLPSVEQADRAFVVALMAEIHVLLLDQRPEMRDSAVAVVIALLQQRRGVMSDLLITEISRSEGRAETIDLMNRGGFGALLVAHEAASLAENVGEASTEGDVSRRQYSAFFKWLEQNETQVASVFQGIHILVARLLPGIDSGASSPEEAIENEQKIMLLKLTSQDSSDRTILGGLERAGLAQRSHDKTAESHALWRRQGFDDLSSGALQWKSLLRQLKGSCSIWEGALFFENYTPFVPARLIVYIQSMQRNESIVLAEKSSQGAIEIVTRWKLDLTEGYERQRRRLLPNYEFHSLYNIDETVDQVKPEGAETVVAAASEEPPSQSDSDNDDESIASLGVVPKTLLSSAAPGDEGERVSRRGRSRQSIFIPAGDSVEATAALLKEMNLGNVSKMRSKKNLFEEDDEADDADEGDEETETASISTATESAMSVEGSAPVRAPENERDIHQSVDEAGNTEEVEEDGQEAGTASSYDLITGLLQIGDWPEKSYNVSRCMGLEVRKALLLWCRDAIYVVDGFEQTDGEGLEGKINRVEKQHSSFYISLRPQDFTSVEEDEAGHGEETPSSARMSAKAKAKEDLSAQDSSQDATYQHRSQRIPFRDLYSVYRRRYQLQQIALEFYDVHRNGTLIAFSSNAEREEVLSRILSTPLPNSIFSSSYGTSINYKKFMNTLRAKITSQWVNGRMTNFDFLMHLNSLAGRSYNDLTQYPVFPWIIADYESEELDLNSPKTYRDLSKPMGALAEARAEQFRERYEALEANYVNQNEPPPFHYGTHYSCAAYVLYYLMRLEPFSRLALTLQGGHFDVADRLFYNIGASWKSASTDNIQDVRELIPEFFYLPEFLTNENMFDFGITQSGKTVHHVTLPPWAKGDPKRFIRINRQALESDYVSKNLHKWVDLVFGYKQRGREAVLALNTFVHVTYEGQVDLDNIDDQIQRDSIIAQINNFGQTPSRLETKPFPQRNVVSAMRDKNIDFGALATLAPLTPPFCVVGAPNRVFLRVAQVETCRVGMGGQPDASVGDMCMLKGQVIGVGKMCTLITPAKKYYRYGGANNGVSVHVAVASSRYREANRVLSIHDGMHRAPISVAKASLNGRWLVTGCLDSTVRVWKYDDSKMDLQATFSGHQGGQITCVDISTTFGTIVTGGTDGNVLTWDLRSLTFLKQLRDGTRDEQDIKQRQSVDAVISVSINDKTGDIVTLLGSKLSVFDINGHLRATPLTDEQFVGKNRASCAISTDCAEWMENGVNAITGHVNGDIRLWSIVTDTNLLVMRHLVSEKVHTCPITSLVTYGDREDTLLVGDQSGKISVCKTLQLENLNQQELNAIVKELRGASATFGEVAVEKGGTSPGPGGASWMGLVTGAEQTR